MDVGVKQMRARISELLDRVQRGERVTVVRRGKPAAVLAPVGAPVKRLPRMGAFRASIRVRGATLSATVSAQRDARRG